MYIHIFYTNVLRLLDERGMTKHELAEKAGISISFLSDLTNGKANPSLKIMQNIAEALETPLPYLLELTDLDEDTLLELDPGIAGKSSLPAGFERVSVVLPTFQAYQVKQWARLARKKTRR